MRALKGEVLLTAFDEAWQEHDLHRALTLLSVAAQENTRQELADLPLAARNDLLLRLREISFGGLIQGVGTCPQCGVPMEFTLPVSELRASMSDSHKSEGVTWSDRGTEYAMRPVTTSDLLSVMAEPGIHAAQEMLLSRCISVFAGQERRADLPSRCEQIFEEVNYSAEIRCAFTCTECASVGTLDFDIPHFLWREVHNAAQRLLSEIHEIAGAYGWSEQMIAHMTPHRRRVYLEMLNP